MPELSSLRFRTAKSLSAQERAHKDEEIVKLAIWASDYAELESVLGDKRPNQLGSVNCADPEPAAASMRRYLELPEGGPIADLPSVLSRGGIKLYFFDADIPRLSVASVGPADGGPCIAVNRHGLSVERRLFTIAHELGHLVLHRDSYGNNGQLDSEETQEREADWFAAFFLMPRQSFLQRWNEESGRHWVDRILTVKRYFQVSYQTVLMRLRQTEKTGEDVHKELAVAYKERYGHDLKNHFEPASVGDGVSPKERRAAARMDFCEERFPRLVRTALENGKISVSRAAELLRISLEQMRSLRESWLREPVA